MDPKDLIAEGIRCKAFGLALCPIRDTIILLDYHYTLRA